MNGFNALLSIAALSASSLAIANTNSDMANGRIEKIGAKYYVVGKSATISAQSKSAVVAHTSAKSAAVIDTSFGTAGIAKINASDFTMTFFTGLGQFEGKLYFGGQTTKTDGSRSVGAVRFNNDGTHDSSYSGQLPYFDSSNYYYSYRGYGITSTGKVVIAGYKRTPNVDPVIQYNRAQFQARLTSNGELDSGFGGSGVIHVAADVNRVTVSDSFLQSDGSLLICGSRYNKNADESISNYTGFIERRHSDGSLDTTFGGDGSVEFEDFIENVIVLADGSIVAKSLFGVSSGGDPTVYWTTYVYKMNSVGAPDNAFGESGRLELVDYSGYVVAPGKNNKIYLGGDTNNSATTFVLRLNSDGTPDSSFGTAGYATEENGGAIFDIDELSNDKILLMGDTWDLESGGSATTAFLARLNGNGSKDTSFGDAGVVELADDAYVYESIVMQSDGAVVVPMKCDQSLSSSYACLMRVKDAVPSSSAEGSGKKAGGGSVPLLLSFLGLVLAYQRKRRAK